MIRFGTCAPMPGLYKHTGVYACAVGVWVPQVLVDPIIRGKPGEQALVAHEAAHVEGRHALKFMVAVIVGFLLTGIVAVYLLAQQAGVLRDPWWWSATAVAGVLFWWGHTIYFLKTCEIEADRYALDRTDPKTFVAFLHMHPHPKGRWGRWLYGASVEARIQRVLPE